MTEEYKLLKKIMNIINDKENLNKDNIIEKIQEELKRKDQDLYKKWSNNKFDVNHVFASDNIKHPENRLLCECTLSKIAAEAGYINVLNALIESGANIGDKSGKGWTPVLHLAAEHGHLDTVEALLQIEGIKVGDRCISGNTALHYAANGDQIKVVEVLIEKGADVNAKNQDGKTALHYAAKWYYVDTAEVLLKKGANVNAVDRDGKTPLDYAENQNVVKVLLNEGGGSFLKARNKAMIAGGVTTLLGTAIAVALFTTGIVTVESKPSIPIAVVKIAAIALVVGGATYMLLKPSTEVGEAGKSLVLVDIESSDIMDSLVMR